MRKILTAVTAVLMLCGIAVMPASASQDTAQAPAAAQASATGWAMGGYPNYWTVCAANGVGTAYWANLVGNWTWPGHELDLRVQNRCDGYSITNRFTFTYYTDANDPNCAKITNNHRTWSPARGKYIWDQNPILWVNLKQVCIAGGSVEYDHRVQMYVGWLLGLNLDPTTCYCVMGSGGYDRGNTRYVVLHDILDMDVVYRH